MGRYIRLVIALLVAMAIFSGSAAAQSQSSDAPQVTRLILQATSAANEPTVRGIVAAVDNRGQPVTDFAARGFQASLDDQPATLTFGPDRPSVAVGVALLLDSSANAAVRSTLRQAIASGLQDIDIRRDGVGLASTTDRRSWDQTPFTTSASDLRQALDSMAQSQPLDDVVSLDRVAGLERALGAQSQDVKVLLLVTNRILASAASPSTSMAVLRQNAIDQHLQVGVLVLPQANGQGIAEALAESTPGGGVEYVLNATNASDVTQRVASLLAPALGARPFSLPAPAEGTHTLTASMTGLSSRAQASFSVTGRAVAIDAIEANGAALASGSPIDRATWLTVHTASNASLEGVEWGVDGRLTQPSSDPYALLLDPDQVGDGSHEITARAISQGRPGPLATTTVYVPFDAARTIRRGLREWGLLLAAILANVLIAFLLVRWVAGRRGVAPASGAPRNEFPPVLRLKQRAGGYVSPEVIDFPVRGKLRIGHHPPYMDNHVGVTEFGRLAYQDIRGDDDTVRDLSRHAACIWRDPETNDCFIQLGWHAPGEPLQPKLQTQVLHLGKPQDATNKPYRLSHQDVIRLASKVEYVFNQLALRDKPTPERKKLDAFASDEPEVVGARITPMGRYREDEAPAGVGEEP